MNNTGVMGLSLPPKNDFEHARGPRNSAYAVNLTYDRHTYIQCTAYYTSKSGIWLVILTSRRRVQIQLTSEIT